MLGAIDWEHRWYQYLQKLKTRHEQLWQEIADRTNHTTKEPSIAAYFVGYNAATDSEFEFLNDILGEDIGNT